MGASSSVVSESSFAAPIALTPQRNEDPVSLSHNHLELLFNADAIFERVAEETWVRRATPSQKSPSAGQYMVIISLYS